VELSADAKDDFRDPGGVPALGDGKGDFSGEGAPINSGLEIDGTIGDSLKKSRGNIGPDIVRDRREAEFLNHGKDLFGSDVSLHH
jgi:hypothetical protein